MNKLFESWWRQVNGPKKLLGLANVLVIDVNIVVMTFLVQPKTISSGNAITSCRCIREAPRISRTRLPHVGHVILISNVAGTRGQRLGRMQPETNSSRRLAVGFCQKKRKPTLRLRDTSSLLVVRRAWRRDSWGSFFGCHRLGLGDRARPRGGRSRILFGRASGASLHPPQRQKKPPAFAEGRPG